MKNSGYVILLILFILTSCSPVNLTPDPSLILKTTATSVPSITPLLTPTPEIYMLRIEFSTTSDWSYLVVFNSPLRKMNLVEKTGEASANIYSLNLNQPLQSAGADQQVSMVVDYVVHEDSLNNLINFQLQKGAINDTTIRFYTFVEGEQILLKEVIRQGFVSKDMDLNRYDFSFDPIVLKEIFTHPELAIPAKVNEVKEVEERVERVAEFPAQDDMTIRIWQERPTDVTLPRKVLPYGIFKRSYYDDLIYQEIDGISGYYLSGILLKNPELDGETLRYELGIPDYSRNEFRKFTLLHKITSREMGNPYGALYYYYAKALHHGNPGGYNVDLIRNTSCSMDEALLLLDQSVGKQIAFLVPLGDTSDWLLEYLDSSVRDRCSGYSFCIDPLDEIIDAMPESEQILNALRNQNPSGYEDKELLIWIAQPIIPLP